MPGPWQDHTRATMAARMAADTLAVFVVDDPAAAGQPVSCAVGTIEERFGGPRDPNGRIGYVFNVVTDPAFERRGYARACMDALIGWFGARRVARVELKASTAGRALYERMGFSPSHGTAMRLFLP
jgi:GNAT superfamily N-acetyltransferase